MPRFHNNCKSSGSISGKNPIIVLDIGSAIRHRLLTITLFYRVLTTKPRTSRVKTKKVPYFTQHLVETTMNFMESAFLIISCLIPSVATISVWPVREKMTIIINAILSGAMALGIFALLASLLAEVTSTVRPPFVFETLTIIYIIMMVASAGIPLSFTVIWAKLIKTQEDLPVFGLR